MNDNRSQLQIQIARALALLSLAAGIALTSVSGSVFAQEDLTIGGGLTVIGQSISDADYATNGTNDVDPVTGEFLSLEANGTGITYSVDLTFEKELESGNAFLYLIAAQGNAVYAGSNADAEGDVFSSQSLGGGQAASAGVAEAWYEHKFFDEMFAIRLGKIDPTAIYDANEVANDQTTQFLADVFVNNSSIAFPSYTPGVNLGMALGEVVSLSFGIYEETEPATIAGEFEYTFFIGELGLHYEMFDNPGNFRITGWSSGVEDARGDSRTGFTLGFDQGFGDEFMAIFMRFGFVGGVDEESVNAEPETAVSFSTGMRMNFGEGHHFGLAYALDAPQDIEFYDLDGNLSDRSDRFEVGSRGWLEAVIDFQVTEGFNLALDGQLISGADYLSESDTIYVVGLRTQVTF